MNHIQLFKGVSLECSALVTKRYSTSFSLGIKMFDPKIRGPIYAIYGFVRFADEIVDTFHDHDKEKLLKRFREDAYTAIQEKLSLNPILESFQQVVNQYQINMELIDAFMDSMEMDLTKSRYQSNKDYETYIYGSAEVVGLMCLKVFCNGNLAQYEELTPTARSLGGAFQKINFLRDIKSDFDERGRVYFPGIDFSNFSEEDKKSIEADIKKDFDHAYQGIIKLPVSSRFGVYLAYRYYLSLFYKIKSTSAEKLSGVRIRVSDGGKAFILAKSALRASFNLL